MNNFWMDEAEQNFLLDYIENNNVKSMLEWGSGDSTLTLQNKVERLTSVEHHLGWYNKLKPQLNENVEYIYAPPNNPDWEKQYNETGQKNAAGDDGTFTDFATYVHAPLRNAPLEGYDLIFVDGRARAACAFASQFFIRDYSNSRIFIHDFGPEARHPSLGHRTYYDIVLEWLELDKQVKTMACFKVKT